MGAIAICTDIYSCCWLGALYVCITDTFPSFLFHKEMKSVDLEQNPVISMLCLLMNVVIVVGANEP